MALGLSLGFEPQGQAILSLRTLTLVKKTVAVVRMVLAKVTYFDYRESCHHVCVVCRAGGVPAECC